MDHHVVTHGRWHLDEPPVQADVAPPGTGSPSPPLIPHADVRHNETVGLRELQQTRRQLSLRPAPQVELDFGRQRLETGIVMLAAKLLFLDPDTLAFGEGGRLAPRTPPGNRHSDGAIIRHTNHVSPCARVSDEDIPDVKRERRLKLAMY
ncbi:MAG TPA: hypothetical protein VM818_11505 [Vicinamibacterales bacterium]|nr:hypothetical protein [Vicinamibacterales bacterium]